MKQQNIFKHRTHNQKAARSKFNHRAGELINHNQNSEAQKAANKSRRQEVKNRVLPAASEDAVSATFGDEEGGSVSSATTRRAQLEAERGGGRGCCGWLWVARWFLESGAWWQWGVNGC
ncbi:uncharacterized protein DS421_3g102140 [Arachis hypogaea]|nr:uncharacterized protein DS421_3g102140 [Arachis hypogaea]